MVESRNDAILIGFMRMVEETPGVEGMDVTLTVGGTLIGGRLVPVRTYCVELCRSLDVALGPRGPGEKKLEDLLTPAAAEATVRADQSEQEPNYIHLSHVRVLTTKGVTHFPGMLWRGRLADVQGFTLGAFSEVPALTA